MYNEEKKLAWIEDAQRRGVLSNLNVATSHLRRMSAFIEEPLDADILDLLLDGRKDDAVRMGNRGCGFTTYSTVRRFVQTINAYIDWRFAVDLSMKPTQNQRFNTYDFSLVDSFRSNSYIKNQDELAAAMSHKRIEDGELLPVFASLAWIGFEPTEMVKIQQKDVTENYNRICIQGKIAPLGFVNDTLLYYSRHEVYNHPPFLGCVKESGPEFLRNIIPQNSSRGKADMLKKIRYVSQAYTLPTTKDGTSFYQLKQAGVFERYLAAERSGEMIDINWIQADSKCITLTAKEHYQEYLDFKEAIGR